MICQGLRIGEKGDRGISSGDVWRDPTVFKGEYHTHMQSKNLFIRAITNKKHACSNLNQTIELRKYVSLKLK
jgi:hypothetical protein